MLEDTRQKVLSTSERITTLTAELNDGNSKIEEMKAEFNRIVSWSKIFDESPMEVKKMICGYIIKKVSVFRDYRVKIEFNINVEQFLNGIDSIDECDTTYELPMAQYPKRAGPAHRLRGYEHLFLQPLKRRRRKWRMLI